MTNPFDPPEAGGPTSSAPGEMNVGVAFEDAWGALTRNWLLWIPVMILSQILIVVSALFCFVPVLVVGPLMGWGLGRWTLDALDGEAAFETLFSGADRVGEIVPKMLGLFGLGFLAMLPVLFVSFASAFAEEFIDEASVGILIQLGSTAFNAVWGAVIYPRLIPAFFMVIERGDGPLEAITESWNVTQGAWLQLIGIYVIAALLNFIGFMMCCVGMIPATLLGYAMWGSAYRQLTGSR